MMYLHKYNIKQLFTWFKPNVITPDCDYLYYIRKDSVDVHRPSLLTTNYMKDRNYIIFSYFDCSYIWNFNIMQRNIPDDLHQFNYAFRMPRQLRANLLTQFWSYISDALNFLGLLGCAGDDGASALPGAFRFWSLLPTLSPDIQWILMRSIVLEKKNAEPPRISNKRCRTRQDFPLSPNTSPPKLVDSGTKVRSWSPHKKTHCQKNLIVWITS